MDYLRGDVTEDEFRSGLIDAAIGLLVIIPLALAFIFPRGQTGSVRLTLFAFLVVGIVPIYVTIKLRSVVKSGSVMLPPHVTFVLIAGLAFVLAIIPGVAGGPASVFRPTIILVSLYVAVVGDRSAQLAFWVLNVCCFTFSVWENGERGDLLISSVVVMASVIAVLPPMVRVPVLGLMALQRARSNLQGIIEVALTCDTMDEGLRRCLPMVTTVIPVSRVGAFVKEKDKVEYQPVAGWPSVTAADPKWVRIPWHFRALETGQCVIEGNIAFVPVGPIPGGDLMLVLEVRKEKKNNYMLDTFTKEMGEELVGAFVRLSNHVTAVASFRELSRRDPLTGLANRRVLMERTEAEMERARSSQMPFSVAIVDIDLFKHYNDNFGHLAGDALLRQLAENMNERLRSTDFLARYGGEEFCALLPQTDLQGAYVLIDALRKAVRQVPSISPVSVSAGVATWDGCESFESLLARADGALYGAKENGRDRVVC